MRRKDREITDLRAKIAVLDKCSVLHLALNDGGLPYSVPLNFGYEETDGSLTLYFHCASQGKKLDILRKHPRACFSAVASAAVHGGENPGAPCSWTCSYESVCGEGYARILEGSDLSVCAGKKHALDRIMAHCGFAGGLSYPDAMARQVFVICVHITELTAKYCA